MKNSRTAEIKWIFFDLGSTLIDESEAYRHRIRDAVEGSHISYEEFYDTMMKYYRESKKGDLETIKLYGLKLTQWHSEDERLYPEALNCLQKLSRRYKIGIIANQPAGTAERLKKYGIADAIRLVISSAEERLAKPDSEIFRLALIRAGCTAGEAVMVGDRLDNDVAPANLLGMTTIWVRQGFGRFSRPASDIEQPDYTADDLNEVLNILIED